MEEVIQNLTSGANAIGRPHNTFSLRLKKGKDECLEFLHRWGANKQAELAVDPTWCCMGGTPTLTQVSNVYGYRLSINWLIAMLTDYQNLIGIKEDNKLNVNALADISKIIYNKYKHLKLAEFMLFFQRMKLGDYGKVYGCIDFAYISRSLRQFCDDRAIIIDRELQRRREEEYRDSLARSVSREEYERMVAAGWKPSAE